LLPMRRVHLNGADVTDAIRSPEISALASQVASIGVVRAAMVAKQRELAKSTPNCSQRRLPNAITGTETEPNRRYCRLRMRFIWIPPE
jgi:hypothetical protein